MSKGSSAAEIEFGNPLDDTDVESGLSRSPQVTTFETDLDDPTRDKGGVSQPSSQTKPKRHRHKLSFGASRLLQRVGLGDKRAVKSDVDPRAALADATFQRIFKMVDYNRDHSLRDTELFSGLQVMENAWKSFAKLFPVSKIDFASNNLGGQQKVYRDLTRKLVSLNGDELREKAIDEGVDEQLLTVSIDQLLDQIVDRENKKEAKMMELGAERDVKVLHMKLVTVPGVAQPLHYKEQIKSLSEEKWRDTFVPRIAQAELMNDVRQSAMDRAAAETVAEFVQRGQRSLEEMSDHARAKRQNYLLDSAALAECSSLKILARHAAAAEAELKDGPETKLLIDDISKLDTNALRERAALSADPATRRSAYTLDLDELRGALLLSDTWGRKEKEATAQIERLTYSFLLERARTCGVPSHETNVSDRIVKELILDRELHNLCKSTDLTDVLLPCAIAVADTMGGKLPQNLGSLCDRVSNLLDEESDAVDKARAKVKTMFGTKKDQDMQEDELLRQEDEAMPDDKPLQKLGRLATQGAAIEEHTAEGEETETVALHPDYERLLNVLTDPYMLHIVLSQLDAWQMLFCIFDLRRRGTVALPELQQGLRTACSPEIDIVQTSNMVSELLSAMEFVIREKVFVQEIVALTVDSPSGLGSRPASSQDSRIRILRKSHTTALKYISATLPGLWQRFKAAVARVADVATHSKDMEDLDELLYGLRYVTHSLLKELRNREKDPQVLDDIYLQHQLQAFRSGLGCDVMKTCTRVMNAHAELYHAHKGKQSTSEVLRKYVSAYLLRRRLKLLARVSAWTKDARKHTSHRFARTPRDPLVQIQAHIRGKLDRMRINRLGSTEYQDNEEQMVKAGTEFVVAEAYIEYFDWPRVLIQYLKARPELKSLRDAAMHILKMLKQARLQADRQTGGEIDDDEEEEEEEEADDDSDDDNEAPVEDGESLPFPQILLDEQALETKLQLLRNTLQNWNELLMMLDKNSSGNLNPDELRCALMAFAEMGVITEPKEFQPMNETYAPWKDKVYWYKKRSGAFHHCVGWDSSLTTSDPENPKKKVHPVFLGRQAFVIKNPLSKKRHKAVISDYPIYTLPGSVMLAGAEGVPISKKSWALTLEFQFDEPTVDAFIGARKYSVLVSSYRNNAIVVRNSGTLEHPGIQLLFIQKDAFEDATMLLQRCKKYEQEGVDLDSDPQEEDADSALKDSAHFLAGMGTYAITPFIPMEQLRWYSLQIVGKHLPKLAGTAAGKNEMQKFDVRIDPLNNDGSFDRSIPPLMYDRGVLVPDQPHVVEGWKRGATAHKNAKPKVRPAHIARSHDDRKLSKPWLAAEWVGLVDMEDIYSIGNVYNNLCSDASDDVEWSIGALRNVRIFVVKTIFLNSRVKFWPDSTGRMDESVFELSSLSTLTSTPRRRHLSSSPRSSASRRNHPVEDTEYDMLFCLGQAMRSPRGEFWTDSLAALSGKAAIYGLYQLSATLQRSKNGRLYVRMQNDWNKDYEPGFQFSNDIINRKDPVFLASKAQRTTNLIKAMLNSVPSSLQDNLNEKDLSTGRYWKIGDYLEMDSHTLFIMRGQTAQEDPGLNVLFTGPQLKSAIKAMTRSVRVNRKKCNTVWKFFVFPWLQAIKLCRSKNTKLEMESAIPILLYHVRKTTGRSPGWIIFAVFIMWLLLLVTILGSLVMQQGPLHSLEPTIALIYYLWATMFVSLEVSNEVSRSPSDISFEVAFKKAELALMNCEVTRINDGQMLRVSAIGLMQMVCWLHDKDDDEDEEEEDEEDEEEEDPFSVGRSTLDVVWCQSELQQSMPFVGEDTEAREAIFEFEVNGQILSGVDWDERNTIYMQGMQTELDVGKPTQVAQYFLMCLAGINAMMGIVLRTGQSDSTFDSVMGETVFDSLIVLGCPTVTFVCSYYVYYTLFCTAFQWYTVLTFLTQMAQVLVIEGAMYANLPCYIDLRHEGNLEAWYCAREFVNLWTEEYIFGTKAQMVVATSLIISALVSLNAVTNYFSDSANIDWTNPGSSLSLLNMLTLCALLFLALVALEKINAETTKLVKKLDLVSIEVSSTSAVAQSAKERLDDDREHLDEEQQVQQRISENIAEQRAAKETAKISASATDTGIAFLASEMKIMKQEQAQLKKTIQDIFLATENIVNRQEINTEYQYLTNIIAELRDQSESKKIFGVVVDRLMLSRIFGGVAFTIYLIFKEMMDSFIRDYAPPTFPAAALAGAPATSTGAVNTTGE